MIIKSNVRITKKIWTHCVIPAKAGIQLLCIAKRLRILKKPWIPVFAGMTALITYFVFERNVLKKIIFPLHCIVCDAGLSKGPALCTDCMASMPRLKESCVICADSLAPGLSGLTCGRCLKKPPAYDQVIAAHDYEGILRKLVSRLKFGRDLLCADLLATMLVEHVQSLNKPLPELIIPVPLHRKRLFKRGYNQALEIARMVSRQLNIPIDMSSCIRERHTQAQAELAAEQRSKNVRHAFSVAKPLIHKHIAILDDVVTTGATVHELALSLKRAGVERVDVWCCARTQVRMTGPGRSSSRGTQ